MTLEVTQEQVTRYEVCRAAVDGRMTNTEAAEALRLSVRQVQRLKGRVKAKGLAGMVHGNQGREPPNKTPPALRQRVIELADTEYEGFNYSHLADMLAEEEGIVLSDETLRRWLAPRDPDRPVRRVKKHRRRRPRRPREGELLFLDGSPHPWFGPDHPQTCLLLASDDATGKPFRGKFQPAEDRDGCFEVTYHVCRKYGLPAGFYIDCASQFKTTRHGGQHVAQGPETDETHFQRAMRELGIGVIFAHSPQARGRAERLNGSFQNRLVAELRRAGITDCDAATDYVNRVFIPRYQKRFGRPPRDPVAAWRPRPAGVNLKTVLCAKYTRTVANDNTLRFQGRVYQLTPPRNCRHLFRAKVEVQKWFDGTVHICHPVHGMLRAKLIDPDGKEAAG